MQDFEVDTCSVHTGLEKAVTLQVNQDLHEADQIPGMEVGRALRGIKPWSPVCCWGDRVAFGVEG